MTMLAKQHLLSASGLFVPTTRKLPGDHSSDHLFVDVPQLLRISMKFFTTTWELPIQRDGVSKDLMSSPLPMEVHPILRYLLARLM
jgi:hypothetical protein